MMTTDHADEKLAELPDIHQAQAAMCDRTNGNGAAFSPTSSVPPEDIAELMATIGDGMQIRRRYQFFVWTQGRLQAMLPHGILVCGLPRNNGPRMFFDYFYNIPVPPETLGRLCHPRAGVACDMMEAWLQLGADPLIFANGSSVRQTARITRDLAELNLGISLVHGIPSPQGGGAHSFFAFIAMHSEPNQREQALVQALVPHMFGAYCRALARDKVPDSPHEALETDSGVTEREIEILRWVRHGKSNQEIGMILSISPLTVKNHIQKILRKLQASNRAQAVSKAIAMKLLGSAGNVRDSLPVGSDA